MLSSAKSATRWELSQWLNERNGLPLCCCLLCCEALDESAALARWLCVAVAKWIGSSQLGRRGLVVIGGTSSLSPKTTWPWPRARPTWWVSTPLRVTALEASLELGSATETPWWDSAVLPASSLDSPAVWRPCDGWPVLARPAWTTSRIAYSWDPLSGVCVEE